MGWNNQNRRWAALGVGAALVVWGWIAMGGPTPRLTQSEWAAWVQAGGGVAAICATVSLAYQERRRLDRSETRELHMIRQRADAADATTTAVLLSAKAAIEAAKSCAEIGEREYRAASTDLERAQPYQFWVREIRRAATTARSLRQFTSEARTIMVLIEMESMLDIHMVETGAGITEKAPVLDIMTMTDATLDRILNRIEWAAQGVRDQAAQDGR